MLIKSSVLAPILLGIFKGSILSWSFYHCKRKEGTETTKITVSNNIENQSYKIRC